MLFFPISKIFWGLFAPSHMIGWTSIAAAILLMTRRKRAGRALAVISALLLIFIGIIPASIWLLRPLEFQYGRPNRPLSHITGILTLSGGQDPQARLAAADCPSPAISIGHLGLFWRPQRLDPWQR